MTNPKATFADIVADALDPQHVWYPRQAAAILADPRLVELLAGAMSGWVTFDYGRGEDGEMRGEMDAEQSAAAIIRSLREATA